MFLVYNFLSKLIVDLFNFTPYNLHEDKRKVLKMTKEQLQTRIEKKKQDIAKIEKRIAKWTKGMNPEAQALCAACELTYNDPGYEQSYRNYIAYERNHKDDKTVYNDDWNKGPSMDEARRAYVDLAEAKYTLNKYETEINKLENFSKMEKIPAIWDFLQEWRKEAYDYFISNCELYKNLLEGQKEAEEAYKKTDEYKEAYEISSKYDRWGDSEYHVISRWKEKYYAGIHSVTKMVFDTWKKTWDVKKLNTILDKDVQNKYDDFVHRITEKAGEIMDASGLHMGNNMVINGVVIGSKNKVRVETITAGGYNTDVIVNVKHGQILHYRVLVKVIK